MDPIESTGGPTRREPQRTSWRRRLGLTLAIGLLALVSIPLSIWIVVEVRDAFVAWELRRGLSLSRSMRGVPATLPVLLVWLLTVGLGSTALLRATRSRRG